MGSRGDRRSTMARRGAADERRVTELDWIRSIFGESWYSLFLFRLASAWNQRTGDSSICPRCPGMRISLSGQAIPSLQFVRRRFTLQHGVTS